MRNNLQAKSALLLLLPLAAFAFYVLWTLSSMLPR